MRQFTYIDKYGFVHFIYGETLADAISNYEAEQVFTEDDEEE